MLPYASVVPAAPTISVQSALFELRCHCRLHVPVPLLILELKLTVPPVQMSVTSEVIDTTGSATTVTTGKLDNCNVQDVRLAFELWMLNVTVPVLSVPVGKLIVPPVPATGVPRVVFDGCNLN